MSRTPSSSSGRTTPELRLPTERSGSWCAMHRGAPQTRCSSCTEPADQADDSCKHNSPGELFGPGQLLDINRCFVILPDGIGHGKSSKPSDGMHAHFPAYDYDDMVARSISRSARIGSSTLALDHGYLNGLHALLCLGRNVLGRHGRADAHGMPTRANCWGNRVCRKMLMDATATPCRSDGEYKKTEVGLLQRQTFL